MTPTETIERLYAASSLWKNQTPCFVVDREAFAQNLTEMRSQLAGEIVYSYKTNPNPLVAQLVQAGGFGFLLSSPYELVELLHDLHPDPATLIFQSPSLTPAELETVLGHGVYRFIVDSRHQLDLILNTPAPRPLELLIRINTGVKVQHPELPYGMDSFLGFPLAEAKTVLAELQTRRTQQSYKLGLHNHLLSQNTHLELWQENLGVIATFATELKQAGIEIDFVDFGGGYPVTYHAEAPALSEITPLINAAVRTIRESYPNIGIIFEPGRKTVAEAITLIGTVAHTKVFNGQNVAILDCSLYNASLDTLIVGLHLPAAKDPNSPGPEMPYVIRGSTPDSLDVFVREITLPELKSGDHIAFLRAGAYSFGSDFISLPKPKHVLI